MPCLTFGHSYSAPTEGVIRGHEFIWPKLVILNIFWAKWDGLDITKCQKPPKFLFWIPKGPGKGGQLGAIFPKISILTIFADISSNWSWYRAIERIFNNNKKLLPLSSRGEEGSGGLFRGLKGGICLSLESLCSTRNILTRFLCFASLLVIPRILEIFWQDFYTLPHFWSFL